MNGLEAAIRSALERAGNPDVEQRARIYESARVAVEKSLEKQEQVDPATIAAQRERVEAVIAAIEAERQGPSPAEAVFPAVQSPAGDWPTSPAAQTSRVDPPVPSPVAVDDAGETAHVEPISGEKRISSVAPPRDPDGATTGGGTEFSLSASDSDRLGGMTESQRAAWPLQEPAPANGRSWFRRKPRPVASETPKSKRRKRRGGGLVGLLVQLGLLFAVIGGGLWLISANGGVEELGRRLADSGAGLLEAPPDGAAVAPAQRVGAGQFSGNWIAAFEPGDIAAIEAGGAATVEAVEDRGEDAVRITSVSAGEEGEVRIPVEGDALDALTNGPALVALTVRTAGGEPTQLYVRCAIAGDGECGRRRFDVNYETTDLLFDVDLSAAGEGPVHLVVNSDVAGEGKSITLFSVRVQPAAAS